MSNNQLDGLKIDKTGFTVAAPGRKRTRIVMLLLAGALISAGVIIMFLRRAIPVETTSVSQVYPTQNFTLLNASGYVVASRKAAVASKTTGRLEWIGVEEGSRVTTGQIIARLENRDLEASVRQAEAGVQISRTLLEQSEAELGDAFLAFTRQQELLGQGIVSKAEFDAAEARYKRARASAAGGAAGIRSATAALQGAQIALDYANIRAPFDAVVLTKNADVGDIITPLGAAANAKAAVVTIADLSSLQVEADVSESNLGQVKAGQPCEITLDALPQTRLRGVVHIIVPTADRTRASVMVKVGFVDKDPRILPEMSAKVAFLTREAQAGDRKPHIAVAASALVVSEGKTSLWLVKDGILRQTPVQPGMKLGDLVQVSGVKPGEKVVQRPSGKLREGIRVKTGEK